MTIDLTRREMLKGAAAMLAGSGLVTVSGMEDAMASTQSEIQALLTTMLKKVVYVAVLVNDQDKALAFYTNVIGLEKRVPCSNRELREDLVWYSCRFRRTPFV